MQEALADVCIDALIGLRGEAEVRIHQILRTTSLVDKYKRQCQTGSWLQRVRAVERLGFFRMETLRPFFLSRLKRESSLEVQIKLIWALSLIANKTVLRVTVRWMTQAMQVSSKFREYIFTNIIDGLRRQGQARLFPWMMEKIRHGRQGIVPLVIQRDMVEACGSAGLYEAIPVVFRFYRHYRDHPEMRIACIRALGKLGGRDACSVIRAGFSDPDWRVRAIAARFSYLCDASVIDFLERLLEDPSYYVRINAAHALASFGAPGRERLQAVIRHTSDPFARKVARYVLSFGRPYG